MAQSKYKSGILPFFDRDYATNATWTRQFLKTIEAAGVESVWTVEHPIVAEDYEKRYSYSEDGSAPFTPTTVMTEVRWNGWPSPPASPTRSSWARAWSCCPCTPQ